MAHKPSIQSEYLKHIYDLDHYRDTIREAVKALRPWDKTYPFDSIAFRGTSGAALAFPLSLRLKKTLMCIRKDDGNHFGSNTIEGDHAANTYVIVDDCVESGDTVRKIVEIVDKEVGAKCVGLYLSSMENMYISERKILKTFDFPLINDGLPEALIQLTKQEIVT